nr:probable serine/threonine-protein kinase ifkA isoform X2 [Dermatophagoides farinae]
MSILKNIVPSVFTVPTSSLSFSCYYCLLLLLGMALIFQQTIIIDAEKQIDTAINVTGETNYDSNYTTNNNNNNSLTLSKSSLNDKEKQQQLHPEDKKSESNMELVDRELLPQIRIIERPSFIERRSDARGKLVSQIVNRASQAFQNLIEHRRNRSRPRLTKFMSERRSSAGRLFPRVRERFVHRIESRKPKPPEPIVDNEQQQDIQFAESRIDGNETAIGAINNQLPPPPPPSQELNDERQFYKQPNLNYELEGQKLRQDIVDKVGHLQTILETAFQVSRERRDLFLSRLLRNTNNRLERAKNRADQILSEPATSELAVKTLHHINNGINNMNLFLHNLLNRINVSINVQMKNPETESSMPNINNNNNNNNNNNSSINNGTTSQTKNNDKDQQS